MQEGGGGERSDRTQAELGRLLAGAGGYRVLASDGTHLGWLDHVRYERHADHPDEVVVRSRRRPRPGAPPGYHSASPAPSHGGDGGR